jgi:hypothetical protein
MSTANPKYETLTYLDEVEIIMDYSDDELLNKLDAIKRQKKILVIKTYSSKKIYS